MNNVRLGTSCSETNMLRLIPIPVVVLSPGMTWAHPDADAPRLDCVEAHPTTTNESLVDARLRARWKSSVSNEKMNCGAESAIKKLNDRTILVNAPPGDVLFTNINKTSYKDFLRAERARGRQFFFGADRPGGPDYNNVSHKHSIFNSTTIFPPGPERELNTKKTSLAELLKYRRWVSRWGGRNPGTITRRRKIRQNERDQKLKGKDGGLFRLEQIHVILTADCSRRFVWRSIAFYYSWLDKFGGRGRITRLMACSPSQLNSTAPELLNAMPTYITPNYRYPEELGFEWRIPNKNERYAAYNKPSALLHFIAEADEQMLGERDGYWLIMDADMVFANPSVFLEDAGSAAKKGHVISAHVGYIQTELDLGLIEAFLPREAQKAKPVAVGDYYIIHRADVLQIASGWTHWAEVLRSDPEKYLEGFNVDTKQNNATEWRARLRQQGNNTVPWISEMHGYVLSTAELGITHTLTRGVEICPSAVSNTSRERPAIVHYVFGCRLQSKLDKTVKYSFDKETTSLNDARLTDCSRYKQTLLPEPRVEEVNWDDEKDSWCAWLIFEVNSALRNWFTDYCRMH